MTMAATAEDFAFRDATAEVTPPRRRGLGFRLDGVAKRFGDKEVLGQVDLDVPAGQFLAIIGKSGCGKSTLLRLLTGLDTPTGGDIVFADDEGRAATRVMFQEPRLLPWASVLGNVEVGLIGLASGGDARNRSQRILTEVGLAEREYDWTSVI